MRIQITIFLVLFVLMVPAAFCQSVGINNPTPAPSSALDISSTTQGLLIPRMTTAQRMAIISPAISLVVFDTDYNLFIYYDGMQWLSLSSGTVFMGCDMYCPANSTQYCLNTSSSSATEGRQRIAMPRKGLICNLFIVPNTNPPAGAIVTATLRVNGLNTGLSCTHFAAAGQTPASNTSTFILVNQGDLISIKYTETGGVNAVNYRTSFEIK